MIRLGLIGDNIAASRAPDLHENAGRLAGLDVSYERLVPREMARDFDGVFDFARDSGMRGLNITYPYKEKALLRVEVDDPMIRRIGAVNTVVFGDGKPKGFNTDYSGFVAAFRAQFGDIAPGDVLLIGAGGAGRAVAFGLLALGARRLVVADIDIGKAAQLASELVAAAEGRTIVQATDDAAGAAADCNGLVNCSPIGMVGYEGSPLAADYFAGKNWAFDAVYTPLETVFKSYADGAGVPFLSGFELFFYQGVQCFEVFTGVAVADHKALREALAGKGG